uniref:Uncharacterized protein n=1 Tax=Plectus sambesii TaxID=2011161 RepID=A0A914V737_9BILA
MLKSRVAGDVGDKEYTAFRTTDIELSDLLDAVDQELHSQEAELRVDGATAVLQRHNQFFEVDNVQTRVTTLLDAMRRSKDDITDVEHRQSALDRLSIAEKRWQDLETRAATHKTSIVDAMSKERHMTELRADYDQLRKEIESRLVAAETQASEMAQRRKTHPFQNYNEAVQELRENETLLEELNACGSTLVALKELLSRIDSLVQSHESAPMKQEIIGLEYRFERLREQISRLVSARSVLLERIQVILTQVNQVEQKVRAGEQRSEGFTDIELD